MPCRSSRRSPRKGRKGPDMRVTSEWLVEALRDKSLPSIDSDELAVRNALDAFIKARAPKSVSPEARIKRLEQFHCEHEFSSHSKGCLESIFCSKCGALHPDWVQTFAHRFGFHDGEEPVGYLVVGSKHYRTRASKPKKWKKK